MWYFQTGDLFKILRNVMHDSVLHEGEISSEKIEILNEKTTHFIGKDPTIFVPSYIGLSITTRNVNIIVNEMFLGVP